MHAWNKLACVVLAWTILPAGVLTASPGRSAHPVQVSTRTTSITLTAARAAAAPAPAVTTRARTITYVVQRGDTLSSIAARFAVHGGWPALYTVNRARVGSDPDALTIGTVLHLPGHATPVRYTVIAGDTLSGIAARFAVDGGWGALYAANRGHIGPDPATIHPGTVLAIPHQAAPNAASPGPGRPQPHTQPTAPSSPPAGHRAHPQPATPRPHTATGMPSWLTTMLLAVGLLAVVIFAAELFLIARRRRRRRATIRAAELPPAAAASPAHPGPPGRPMPPTPLTSPTPPASPATPITPAREAAPMPISTHPTRIVMADHERLVITRSKVDDTICVLRPPGENPAEILRVARLVLPEGPYGTLAEQLGLSASWPMK